MLSLIAGMFAGLHRIGWNMSLSEISPDHGAIMIGGFLGSLISLEKIIPLKKNILYIIPVMSGSSIVWFFLGMPVAAVTMLLAASAGLMIIFLVYLVSERSLIYIMMFAGAMCWFAGNAFLLQSDFYPASLPWWMAFSLLIIASERIELMKFLPVTPMQKNVLAIALLVFLIGGVLSFHGIGNYVGGFALIVISIWLMRYDVVGINLRKNALPRYAGIALFGGYFALLLSGVFLLLLADVPLGYDALIHTFFIGFVFSMIFAHGPIILPGVLGIPVKPYHPMFYCWLALLHASWILRTISDVIIETNLRRISGVVSALAIVSYFVTLAAITIRTQRAKTV